MSTLADDLDAQVTRASERAAHARNVQRYALGFAIAGSALLVVVGALVLTRWLRGPLHRLEEELTRAVGDPDTAVVSAGPAEVVALAGRVDELRRSVLAESEERLRRGLLVAQEEERRRIAGELHDDVIQSLTAVGLRLQMAEADATESQRALLDGAAASASAAIERLRAMVFELYPPALERHGLAAALETFGLKWCEGTDTTFEVHGDAGDSSLTAQAIAYRVAREAVINACKHAHAAAITVTVHLRDGGLSVQVHDDGVGFDPGEDAVPGHLGLAGAEALVVAAIGTWSLTSERGSGTTVEFWLPDLSTD
jgi:signal transduction histidine kinase